MVLTSISILNVILVLISLFPPVWKRNTIQFILIYNMIQSIITQFYNDYIKLREWTTNIKRKDSKQIYTLPFHIWLLYMLRRMNRIFAFVRRLYDDETDVDEQQINKKLWVNIFYFRLLRILITTYISSFFHLEICTYFKSM